MRFKKKQTILKEEEASIQLDTSISCDTGDEPAHIDTKAIMNKSFSLGTGSVSEKGKVSFHPATPPRSICDTDDSLSSSSDHHERVSVKSKSGNRRSAMKELRNILSSEKLLSPVRETACNLSDKLLRAAPVKFERVKSCYLRVADLKMSETSHSAVSDHEVPEPNFHHASVHPPPGVEHDPKERWVAIDTGDGEHAPIAPFAVEALAKFGIESTMNEAMWTPDKKTDKLMKAGNFDAWHSCVWNRDGPLVLPPRGFAEENEVMVWTGQFDHGLYGSDLPAVRAAGILNMSAKALTELLLDSSRIKEYNEMSLGRTDIMVMPGSLEEDGPFGKSVTKVLKSETRPPLLRKTLQFVSVMHSKELDDGSGYYIVTRAVTQPDHGVLDPNILRSEIITSVNLIKKVGGDENRCLMINVNHIRSPMVPMMIAKRIGLSAAANFFHDLRALC